MVELLVAGTVPNSGGIGIGGLRVGVVDEGVNVGMFCGSGEMGVDDGEVLAGL